MSNTLSAPAGSNDLVAESGSALTVRQKIAYALPAGGTNFLFAPISVLQGIYATYFGLSLTTLATILLITRLFDGLTDPLVGYLSDRYHLRTGSRKPFLAWGGILMLVSGYFLYVPVDPATIDASTTVSVAYFLVFYLLFYFASTVFDIPHLAWGSELAASPADSNTLYSWRYALVSGGYLLFYAVPLLPFFASSDITPQTLQWTALAAAVLILPALLVSLKTVPDLCGKKHLGHTGCKNHQAPFRLSMLKDNKPLLHFMVTFLLTGVFNGMYLALSFIYVNSYLDLGEHFAMASLAMFVVSVASIWFWNLFVSRFNKVCTWALGTGFIVASIVLMALLAPHVASLSQLLLIYALFGCGLAVGNIIAPSILSDIIDYSRWKYSADCSASLFAAYQMTLKASMALGGALALMIAGWYGFDPASDVHSSDAISALRLAMIWLPALIGVIAIVFIVFTPITGRRHSIIRRSLALKVHRLNAVRPVGTACGG